MRINLNIIKILPFIVVYSWGEGVWTSDACQMLGCAGCTAIQQRIVDVQNDIDEEHGKLEIRIATKYYKDIIKKNLEKIDLLQEDITKKVAHIRALEYEANIESRHIIFTLRKNKDLYTLPVGAVQ